MKLDSILSKAVRLAKKGKYNEAIKTLESESNRYYGSFIYYYLLGISYLYTNVFGVALTYLKRAKEQKLRDPCTLLGLAALYLNHGDTDKAVDLYLEVQSLVPGNRLAKKALAIIRKHPSPEEISAWIDSGSLHKLFPPFPNVSIRFSRVAVTTLLGIAGLTLAAGIAFWTGLIPSPNKNTHVQREMSAELQVGFQLSQDDMKSLVQVGGTYRYVLTESQVLESFEDARRLFHEHRDEAVRIRLNRILESNAGEGIKSRARIIASFLQVPGFNTLYQDDRFTYSEIIRNPFLYNGVHVIWRGMASDLVVEENSTEFKFLVGYDTRRTMEGIVQVQYDFAVPLNDEFPFEILGRVIPISGEIGIRIQGIALSQVGLLDTVQNPGRN